MSEALREGAAGLFSICALAAALDLLVSDDGAALGFRAVCGMAAALCVVRALSRLLPVL